MFRIVIRAILKHFRPQYPEYLMRTMESPPRKMHIHIRNSCAPEVQVIELPLRQQVRD